MNDWTIESLAHALRNDDTSIMAVAQAYIDRIMEEDAPGPNAVITLNPFWKEDAVRLQQSLFSDSHPLHGIPILIKDNIDTYSMGNSAGSLALKDVPVESDAALIVQLQQAGALILGKTNLSEWANFRAPDSISGWSSLGGQTHNALNRQWSPSGSSSGSAAAIAANFAVAAIGTETDGSIVSPSAHNGLVGLKPQVGRVSRTGIIPIAWSQDTAGPIAKNVRDCAILLQAMSATDPQDAPTQDQPNDLSEVLARCRSGALQKKRIGYLKPDEQFPREVSDQFFTVIERLMTAGADCIELDPLPSMVTLQDHEITVMTSEFPEALRHYFEQRRPASPYRSLRDLHQFNLDHADTVMPHFKQAWFDKCLDAPATSTDRYQSAQKAIELFRGELHELWFKAYDLDAVVTATNGPAWRIDPQHGDRYTGGNSHLAAVSGWPSITVPYGSIEQRSLGALFISPPWQESELLGMAYDFERQQTAG